MRKLLFGLVLAWGFTAPIRGFAASQPVCPGDCGGDSHVTVDELLIGVNIALGDVAISACVSFDSNDDGEVTVEELLRAVAAALNGCPAGPSVIYDRTNTRLTSPFPDDFWLVQDATNPNGVRLNVPIPVATQDVQGIFRALTKEPNKLDGFSPIAHFVIELSEAPEPTSLPRTSPESLAADASIGLFDLTEGSPTRGQRIPFRVDVRQDQNVLGIVSNSLLVFTSIPLEPGGRYGFVITRAMRSVSGFNFAPSSFMQAALGEATTGEEAAVTQVRGLADDVVNGSAIARADIALALRLTVRTTDDIPNDLMAIKAQVLAAPPPHFEILNVMPGETADVAAIIKGTWDAPDWRAGTPGVNFARDAQGHPMQTKTNKLDFWLALPKAAATTGRAPITMYQHGNPGSATREVPSEARRYLGNAGFAVIGFTDILNRELSAGLTDETAAVTAQVSAIFFALVANKKVPDYWSELNAEQLAFLRMIQSMNSIDVLPLGHPDGIPDMDPSLPLTYVGISQGANYAPGFIPYAPEVSAAAIVVGGSRLAETLIHQQASAFLVQLGMVFPNMTATDIWVGLSLFQHMFDRQDEHNHARFIYREPLTVAGTTRKASILQVEGLNDTMVPNNASESLAYALFPLPHLAPVQRLVPLLPVVEGPVIGNIDANTTGAFFQYVPVGIDGIAPTPGCLTLNQPEGHFCAQSAPESQHQRVVFFQSAVNGEVPKIINPLAP